MNLKGRCACGSVMFRIDKKPMFTHACHCLDCQRTTGSAFVLHSVIGEKELIIESGELKSATVTTGSGAGCDLNFCTTCGTFIWVKYRYHKVPVIAIRTGTLYDCAEVAVQAHIFIKSKLPWVSIPEKTPQFNEAYDRNEIWPDISLNEYNNLSNN